jgi:hypothetical protein
MAMAVAVTVEKPRYSRHSASDGSPLAERLKVEGMLCACGDDVRECVAASDEAAEPIGAFLHYASSCRRVRC